MSDNLDFMGCRNDVVEIKKISFNKFEIYVNDVLLLSDLKILEFYIILYSYIKSKYLVIKEILMIKRSVNTEYRNMNFIMNFSYIDFKIWLIRNSNLNDSQSGSSLFEYEQERETLFQITLVDGCMSELEKMCDIENLKPKMPLRRQEILKEILGGIEEIFTLNNDKKD